MGLLGCWGGWPAWVGCSPCGLVAAHARRQSSAARALMDVPAGQPEDSQQVGSSRGNQCHGCQGSPQQGSSQCMCDALCARVVVPEPVRCNRWGSTQSALYAWHVSRGVQDGVLKGVRCYCVKAVMQSPEVSRISSRRKVAASSACAGDGEGCAQQCCAAWHEADD